VVTHQNLDVAKKISQLAQQQGLVDQAIPDRGHVGVTR
jgi:hypothetical protein